MSTSSDSIQTLLKQRRELRGYLQELRDEISALNVRAENIGSDTGTVTTPSGTAAKTSASTQNTGSQTAGLQEAAGVDETPLNTTAKATGHPSASSAGPSVSSTVQPPDTTVQSVSSGPSQTPSDKPRRGIDTEDIDPVSNKDTGQASQNMVKKQPTFDSDKSSGKMPQRTKAKQEDFANIDDDSLLYRATLLSDYFLNHPAPVDKQNLSLLDGAIKKVEDADATADKIVEIANLRALYRTVSSTSFAASGVNGETLADSRGSIGLLWAVPLNIAGLTLVIFPLLLLGRSLADHVFVTDFSNQMTFIMTGITAFLWGAVGALSYSAWKIAKSAKSNTYRNGSAPDVGLKATLGGVLGIVVFVCTAGLSVDEGIILDMTIGLGAFFMGIFSSIIYAVIYSLTHRAILKVDKSL